MTEEEWLACADPSLMLEFLRGKISDRKLRLFACACCRQGWKWIKDELHRGLIQAAESFADGVISITSLRKARSTAYGAHIKCSLHAATAARKTSSDSAGQAALQGPREIIQCFWKTVEPNWKTATDEKRNAQRSQSELLQDVVGNPFRPITISPTWITPTVTNLASIAYNERALPSGELDTARLSILSDALEDAGCENQDVLEHLRSLGPHVRGCHVLDLLLGKE